MLLLISILLISTVISTEVEIDADVTNPSVINQIVLRHDFDSCGSIFLKGACGQMQQINAKLSSATDPARCTTTCAGVAATTMQCALNFPVPGCPSTSPFGQVALPFDNTCTMMPTGQWINLMKNVACGNEALCNNAPLNPAQGSGCMVMGVQDANGSNGDAQAGMTNGYGACHPTQTGGSSMKIPCETAPIVATDTDVVTQLVLRHDFDSCGSIFLKGACGQMNQINAVMTTENSQKRCTATCAGVPVTTQQCAFYFPMENCPGMAAIPVVLPFDNTCGRMPNEDWINIMINVACHTQAACQSATLDSIPAGCYSKGFDDTNGQNGDAQAGMTNGLNQCMNQPESKTSVMKMQCATVTQAATGIVNAFATTMTTGLVPQLVAAAGAYFNSPTADNLTALGEKLGAVKLMNTKKKQADHITTSASTGRRRV